MPNVFFLVLCSHSQPANDSHSLPFSNGKTFSRNFRTQHQNFGRTFFFWYCLYVAHLNKGLRNVIALNKRRVSPSPANSFACLRPPPHYHARTHQYLRGLQQRRCNSHCPPRTRSNTFYGRSSRSSVSQTIHRVIRARSRPPGVPEPEFINNCIFYPWTRMYSCQCHPEPGLPSTLEKTG